MTKPKKQLPAKQQDKPLDEDEIASLIRLKQGNVTEIADYLGVDSLRLRLFVLAKPNLRAVMNETLDIEVDKAVKVLYAGLEDEHYGNRLAAAKELLRSDGGRKRGFGAQPEAQISVHAKAGGSLEIRWLEPDDEVKTIEGEVQHE